MLQWAPDDLYPQYGVLVWRGFATIASIVRSFAESLGVLAGLGIAIGTAPFWWRVTRSALLIVLVTSCHGLGVYLIASLPYQFLSLALWAGVGALIRTRWSRRFILLSRRRIPDRTNQFSIGQLLFATTVVAIVCGLLGWVSRVHGTDPSLRDWLAVQSSLVGVGAAVLGTLTQIIGLLPILATSFPSPPGKMHRERILICAGFSIAILQAFSIGVTWLWFWMYSAQMPGQFLPTTAWLNYDFLAMSLSSNLGLILGIVSFACWTRWAGFGLIKANDS